MSQVESYKIQTKPIQIEHFLDKMTWPDGAIRQESDRLVGSHYKSKTPPRRGFLFKCPTWTLLSVPERTIENMVEADVFPAPVRIRKHVFWSEIAVHRWQAVLFVA